ncbi:ATP-binding protein [Candidatus Parcubacteria bacterium]|nr:ATP-binding protein [Candidatus Parcubacteria bacterium]
MNKIIKRITYSLLLDSLKEKYISVLIGPRQTGKTTLVKKLIDNLKSQGVVKKDILFLNFDDPELRTELAKSPKKFLQKAEQFFGEPISELSSKKYIFLDEVQKLPQIFDILKILYDDHQTKIKIIITGSSSLTLFKKSAETLAGRIRFYYLSALSWREIVSKIIPLHSCSFIKELIKTDLTYKTYLKLQSEIFPEKEKLNFYWNNYLISGGLPEIFLMESQEKKSETLRNYLATYIERDIRGLKQVGDESLFSETVNAFLSRDTQILNFSALASRIGIQRITLKKYFYILRETFLISPLYPFVKQSKQTVKNPKIYFFDHGLTNYYRKIYSLDQLNVSDRLGFVFENIIVNNLLTCFANDNRAPAINFWRDYQDHKIDLVISNSEKIIPIEITYSSKINQKKINNFKAFYKIFPKASNGFIVWQGEFEQFKIGNKTIFAVPFWMWR